MTQQPNLNTPINISKITGEPLKKRGRKPKKDILQSPTDTTNDNITISIEESLLLTHSQESVNDVNNNDSEILNDATHDEEPNTFVNEEDDMMESGNHKDFKTVLKKRGRKPKGGKIIQNIIPLNNNKDVKPNVILHLKCSLKDLAKSGNPFGQSNAPLELISYNEFSYDSICKLDGMTCNQSQSPHNQYNIHNQYDGDTYKNHEDDEYYDENHNSHKSNTSDNKDIYKKLKNLQHNLHINNINNKKSACFWCTCDFDNPPIYIPKHYIKDTYEVYGCFCSPECATAFLMEENIDSSDKFERYHLINHIYTKIYNYTKNIKPAPNPYYMLDKYYGNLSIQEYRGLLRSERLFLVVDKPLTRILPEIHEDNDDFIINNKIIPSNSYQVKKKLQRKTTKTNIVNEKFGLVS
jgi:hypothetical protein